MQAIRARGIADRIGFVLLAPGIPHPELARLLVPKHVRAHHRHLLPGLLRGQHRLLTPALPRHAVGAGRVSDRRVPLGLAGVPEVVLVATLQDHRTVDVILPPSLRSRPENDPWRLAPMDTVLAFHQRQAALWAPGQPHPVTRLFPQHRNIETGAVFAPHYRVRVTFDPTPAGLGPRTGLRGCLPQSGQLGR